MADFELNQGKFWVFDFTLYQLTRLTSSRVVSERSCNLKFLHGQAKALGESPAAAGTTSKGLLNGSISVA